MRQILPTFLMMFSAAVAQQTMRQFTVPQSTELAAGGVMTIQIASPDGLKFEASWCSVVGAAEIEVKVEFPVEEGADLADAARAFREAVEEATAQFPPNCPKEKQRISETQAAFFYSYCHESISTEGPVKITVSYDLGLTEPMRAGLDNWYDGIAAVQSEMTQNCGGYKVYAFGRRMNEALALDPFGTWSALEFAHARGMVR